MVGQGRMVHTTCILVTVVLAFKYPSHIAFKSRSESESDRRRKYDPGPYSPTQALAGFAGARKSPPLAVMATVAVWPVRTVTVTEGRDRDRRPGAGDPEHFIC